MPINKTQITKAMREVKGEKVLSEAQGSRGAGTLQLLIRRGKGGDVTATWFAKWKRNGKVARVQLGTYPDMDADAAREEFKTEAGDALKAKRDPSKAAPLASSPTVENLFKGYVADMRRRDCVSADDVEGDLLKGEYAVADALGRDTLAADVTADDVSAHLRVTFKRGSRTKADRKRAYISAAFNWGMNCGNDYTVDNPQDWGITINPAGQVKRDTGANKKRTTNLDADELRAVWFGMEGKGYSVETTCLVRLVIACGQRVQETLRVDGAEVDIQKALWTMPPEKTKGREREHVIPLPPQAVAVFKLLKSHYGDGPLFPANAKGRNADKRGKYMTYRAISRAVARFVAANEIKPFQPRDLRRSWKSRGGDGAGIDKFTRDLLQQHARTDTSGKHYDMAEYLPKMTAAVKAWGEWLDKALYKTGNVKTLAA